MTLAVLERLRNQFRNAFVRKAHPKNAVFKDLVTEGLIESSWIKLYRMCLTIFTDIMIESQIWQFSPIGEAGHQGEQSRKPAKRRGFGSDMFRWFLFVVCLAILFVLSIRAQATLRAQKRKEARQNWGLEVIDLAVCREPWCQKTWEFDGCWMCPSPCVSSQSSRGRTVMQMEFWHRKRSKLRDVKDKNSLRSGFNLRFEGSHWYLQRERQAWL